MDRFGLQQTKAARRRKRRAAAIKHWSLVELRLGCD